MCGRFANSERLSTTAERLGAELRVADDQWLPSWNIAPTASVPTLVTASGQPRLGLMRWGWRRDWSARDLINAKLETLASAPTWRDAAHRRRAAVPATGWWEWAADATTGQKRPWWHRRENHESVMFGAVWERDAAHGVCLSIVTTAAPDGALAAIHHRAPLLLAPAQLDAWLTPGSDGLAAVATAAAYPAMVVTPAESFGSRADGPELVPESR